MCNLCDGVATSCGEAVAIRQRRTVAIISEPRQQQWRELVVRLCADADAGAPLSPDTLAKLRAAWQQAAAHAEGRMQRYLASRQLGLW